MVFGQKELQCVYKPQNTKQSEYHLFPRYCRGDKKGLFHSYHVVHAYYIAIKLLLLIRKGHNCEKGGKDIVCKLLSVGKIPRGDLISLNSKQLHLLWQWCSESTYWKIPRHYFLSVSLTLKLPLIKTHIPVEWHCVWGLRSTLCLSLSSRTHF